jgi:hypothetical protein
MRFLKPIVALLMAWLIGVTSLGMAVSAHTCSEAGVAETRIGHLKTCCAQAKGHGIQAEPCCKVKVQHVKLATVHHGNAGIASATNLLGLPAPSILPAKLLLPDWVAQIRQRIHPPDKPPLLVNIDGQAQLCRFLI